jgi:probable phosphoglycerate mutase
MTIGRGLCNILPLGGGMRLHFARHGESEANFSGIFSSRGWKHPLTERGRAQASALADGLRNETLAAIYSSPLMRAMETAEIIAKTTWLPVTAEPALREYDVGIYEGQAFAVGQAAFGRVLADWLEGNLDSRVDEGESAVEIIERMHGFLKRLRTDHQEGETILVVTHGGILRVAMPRLLAGLTTTMTLAELDHCETATADLVNRRFVARSWGPAAIS